MSDVFFNNSKHPIFISHTLEYDTGIKMEQKIIIMPNDGIDISLLGLNRKKDEKTDE